MTTYACPKGHASSTDDFCDECGARIGGTVAIPGPASAEVSPPAPAGPPCPNCGAPRAGVGRFCEDCGYDHDTGKVPTLTPPSATPTGIITASAATTTAAASAATTTTAAASASAAATTTAAASASAAAATATTATGQWTATIAVDRRYFEQNAIEGVEFPADDPARRVDLPAPQVRIGRRSSSKGTNPEIDLADSDPGVSHSHALLTLSVDGVWLVCDLGSTNGTYLNAEQQPLAGQTRALKDGDQVHVGAWTTITLHAPPA